MDFTSKPSRAALILLAATAMPTAGLAQAHTPSQSEAFETADRNHDGFIDADEDQATNRARFVKFDANGDGRLSRAEMLALNRQFGESEALSQQVAQLYLTRMDKDHDDAASWNEFYTWQKKSMFDFMDANHDGRLSRKEFIMAASPDAPH